MANIQVTKWALMSSPLPITSILIVYLYVVCSLGPEFMKNRNAYSLKTFMQLYNIFQVAYNVWILFDVVKYAKPLYAVLNYCSSFENVYGDGEKQFEILWWGVLLKIIDLFDTVMFVLRKNNRQVSYLHLYHHVTTTLYIWLSLRYLPHPSVLVLILINTAVHTLMYSYYFLSTFGSSAQRILQPYKKWLTFIQMIQLAFMVINCLQGLTCDNRNIVQWSIITFINGLINLSFFWNFFSKSYKKPKTA